MINNPTKIIVHHSADISQADQLGKINSYHESRNFPVSSFGYYVGYHYLINRKGIMTQTRADNDEGAHCKGHNFDSLGVCLEGNFDTEIPTNEQVVVLEDLLRKLCVEYKISFLDIYPHNEFRNTSCYGSRLGKNWGKIVGITGMIKQLQKELNLLQQ